MRKTACVFYTVFTLFIMSGCAPTRIWISSPAFGKVENQVFNAQFLPLRNDKNFINEFRLVVWNKSDKDLEIDWSATRYIHKGRDLGRFIFEGIDENNVNNPPPDIVPAAGNLLWVIAPVRLIAWKPMKSNVRQTSGFSAGPVPEGESGIALVTRHKGQLIRETLTVNISIEVK